MHLVEGPFINKVYKENNSYFAPRKDIQSTPMLRYNKSNILPLNSQMCLKYMNMLNISFACEEKHCQSGYKIKNFLFQCQAPDMTGPK